MTAALELRNLSKSFGGLPVLTNIDLRLEPGSVHALVGENGAGKSTLVKIVAGVHRRDGGTLRFPQGIVLGGFEA